jgi:hypothetical protein
MRIDPGCKAGRTHLDMVIADEQFLERELTIAVGTLFVVAAPFRLT